jgi:hypothetical protein
MEMGRTPLAHRYQKANFKANPLPDDLLLPQVRNSG